MNYAASINFLRALMAVDRAAMLNIGLRRDACSFRGLTFCFR